MAKVVPSFKKGLKTKQCNYRPILLLCIFSKIVEKRMWGCLQKVLELDEVLFCMHYGFRTRHSTDHAQIALTETIKTTLDNNRFGC